MRNIAKIMRMDWIHIRAKVLVPTLICILLFLPFAVLCMPQVICCVNLTPIHIGSVKSEVRILGTESEQGVVLLRPSEPVKNGDKVF